jgi:hypothetical protein
MPNPLPAPPTPILQQILTDPGAAVSCVAVVINLVFALLSFFVFYHRRGNERKYNLDLTFYELLVLDSSKHLIKFSADAKSLLNSLVVGRRNNSLSAEETRALVEQHIEKLDILYDDLTANVLPFINGYSSKLHKITETNLVFFYDETTVLFSKFNHNGASIDCERRALNKFSELTTIFVQVIFKNIKDHCPKH